MATPGASAAVAHGCRRGVIYMVPWSRSGTYFGIFLLYINALVWALARVGLLSGRGRCLLSPVNTQPENASLAAPEREQITTAIALYRHSPGPLLQILHAVQERLRYVPSGAIALIAEALNLSRAEVHGVVGFYPHFRRTPPGRQRVQVCQAESCRAMQCEALTEHVKQRLGIDFHQTTADGRYTLEPVYCLGNCSCSPALMIDGELHGRVTPERFDVLMAGAGCQAGSSAP